MKIEWSARRNTAESKYEIFTVEDQSKEEANREAIRMNMQLGWNKYRIRELV